MKLTWQEIRDLIDARIAETPEIADQHAVVYQTDNFTRKINGAQFGVGGSFLRATREWD